MSESALLFQRCDTSNARQLAWRTWIGVKTTRAIRKPKALGRKSYVPVIAMTAYAMTGDREKFLGAGMNDYIVKPVDKDVLQEVIERVMPHRPGK